MRSILGLHVDGGLAFDYHVSQICKQARKKDTIHLRYVKLWTKINKEYL